MTTHTRQRAASAQLTLTTAIPPSLNNLYATVRGRRILSADGRQYKQSFGLQVQDAARDQGFTLGGDDRLALTIRLWFVDKRRRDLSNTIKVLEDALAEALGFDDCRIDRLLVERSGIDKAAPRCEVQLLRVGVDDPL